MLRRTPLKNARTRKCRACRASFKPQSSTQVVCGKLDCALEYARQLEAKKRRRQIATDKERIKTLPQLTKEAQRAFNAYIRFRDRAQPCISCGTPPREGGHGGAWDCGHYLTVGAHPELRFVELNAHKQCKPCNGGSGRFSRKGRTVSQEYRDRLIARIGLDYVEWLEGPHEPRRYRAEELRAIRDYYRTALTEAKKLDD